MDIAEQLKSFRKKHDLTQQQLAESAGLSLSALMHYEHGLRRPNYKAMVSLENEFNKRGEKLISDIPFEQKLHKLSTDERELIKLYKTANRQAQETALVILQKGQYVNWPAASLNQDEFPFMITVPVIGRAAAGLPIEMIEEHDGSLNIDDSHVQYGDFAVVADGDSMVDAGIQNGDRVVIRPQPKVESGEIALVAVEGGSTIKRFYVNDDGFKLVPANSQYETQFYSKDTDIRVLGKVIKVINK